jgi:hypothetical protein
VTVVGIVGFGVCLVGEVAAVVDFLFVVPAILLALEIFFAVD